MNITVVSSLYDMVWNGQMMEYVAGGDLLQLVQRSITAKLHIEEVTLWRYLYELAQAVEYLHSRGVIHRDVKCQNVMLTSDGHIKLIDLVSGTYISRKRDIIGRVGLSHLIQLPTTTATTTNTTISNRVWLLPSRRGKS